MDDEYTGRPKIDVDKLDFSEFHPLDHSIWECDDYPGGRRTHLKYRWEFQWSQTLRAKTTCKLGWHYRTGTAHFRESRGPVDEATDWMTQKVCCFCWKKLSEPQPE